MPQHIKPLTNEWSDTTVRGGTILQTSVVCEGRHGISSAYFRMAKGARIPTHHHPKWVQVMVIEGALNVQTEGQDNLTVKAGECYFVEPGETHTETALEDSLVLVTQDEDRAEFLSD
ncbi:MAG: cupin domain-containing protein [Gammaproteobacteria bacterium]|nr:cupin domain-containing protein [Gammaproteobacteria bacterium]